MTGPAATVTEIPRAMGERQALLDARFRYVEQIDAAQEAIRGIDRGLAALDKLAEAPDVVAGVAIPGAGGDPAA